MPRAPKRVIPIFKQTAPPGYATWAQLEEAGLKPAPGQPVAALLHVSAPAYESTAALYVKADCVPVTPAYDALLLNLLEK